MIRQLAPALLVLSACARGVPEAPPSERAHAGPPAPASTASPEPARPTLALESVQAPKPAALALVAPAEGAVLSAADAARTVIVWREPAQKGLFIELGLDGARARPLDTLPTPPTLGALLEPGSSLGAGEHYVVASARTSEDAPGEHTIVRFGVETPVAPSPLVHCSRPAGTLYAPADSPLLLDFVTHAFVPGRDGTVGVRAFDPRVGAGSERIAWLDSAGAHRFSAGSAVDLSIELVLWDNDGRPIASRFGRDTCFVTRNDPKP